MPCTYRRAFTLVEILVVVAIIVLLAVLMVPSIRSMQAGNARAQAYNVINAALQAARSYAIMNSVNTAARFQPNGKIFLVYKMGSNSFQVANWGTAQNSDRTPFPSRINGSEEDYIYLPVLDQEPLILPRGYAASDLQNPDNFSEPFYVCYNPSGNLVVNESVSVALATLVGGEPRPANPDFAPGDSDNSCAFQVAVFGGDYGPDVLTNWINKEVEDASNTDVINHRKLARYYLVAKDNAMKEAILSLTLPNSDYGPDHYTGFWGENHYSTSALALFETPDNWDQMPIFNPNDAEDITTRQGYICHQTDGIFIKQKYDPIHINVYTGRVIRPLQ